jgi:hypothetical protein
MRTRTQSARLVLAAAIATSAVLVLAGCVQPPPHVIPTSEPSTAPVFASDAEALAAAKKAYTGYLTASDQIGNDGGANAQRVSPWVTKDRVAVEVKQFKDFAKTGNHFEGSSTFSNLRLQQVTQSPNGAVVVSAYACDDVSKSRIIDPSGADITPPTRKDVDPIQIEFRNSKPGSKTLLVEGSTLWSGNDFCAQ